MENRIAVVTGANRGIGFEICRQLAQKNIQVILTSRDEAKGQKAVEQLKKENGKIFYHRLDVSSEKSIRDFCADITRKYERCDILVNNAGIFPDLENEKKSVYPSVFDIGVPTLRKAMETNVYGPILLCQAIVPLMKKQRYGRIVNISSGMGQLTFMNGGYPGYRISKTAINSVTRILTDELEDTNILVNSMCPGWVKTEMGGQGATRTTEEGADTAVWLATLPEKGPRGKFFRDRKELAW